MNRLFQNKTKTGLSLIVLALLLLMFFYLFRDQTSKASLLTERVKRGNIENTINASGTLEPGRYVEVGAQVSGQVQVIHNEAGDKVKAGQLLVEIDATVFETRVQNSAASLEGNRAQLEQLQAELELAKIRAVRNKNLFAKNAVSEDSLFASQANVKILQARIRAMNAQIKADAASLAGDKATLAYAKIYAPISGTVVSISVREGQTLNANQNAPVLLKIADLSVLTLRAEVSEADVTRLHKGMEVYFKTFGSGQRRWLSTLRQVLPTPSVINDVVLYQALMDVQNNDGMLMDSMTAQVYFLRNRAENALIVPLGAVRQDGDSSLVVRKNSAGVESVPIEIGVRNRTHAQVLSGLKQGDWIVVGAQARSGVGEKNSLFAGSSKAGRRGF